MRKVVYKYEIQPDGSTFYAASMRPLHVAAVGENLFLWAEVAPGGVDLPRRFFAYATGYNTIPEGAIYVGTALMHGGTLVWHVYEIPVENSEN